MKKLLLAAMLILWASFLQAAGTSTITKDTIHVANQPTRIVLTIAWVDDTAGTTASIVAATYGIEGWFLYSAETNPGSTAPTDNYDIVITDADGVDVAGGLLTNRDTSTSEIANIGTSAHGYPIVRGNWAFTLSGNAVNGATGTCILVFLAN